MIQLSHGNTKNCLGAWCFLAVYPCRLSGVQHIVADRIAKDKDTIEFLIRDACGSSHIMIEACQSKAKKEKETE
jgi:hypothetical protein